MGFKLKNKNIPTNFKANYVRPTNLSIEKSPLKQTGAGSFTGNPLFAKISGMATKAVDDIRKADAEDFIIPQSVQNLVPASVRALGKDVLQNIMGVEQKDKKDITERHFSKRELEALAQARARAEADNRDYITYEDYETSDNKFGDIGGAGFTGGWGGNQKDKRGMLDLIKDTFNPAYSMKTTLGGVHFKKNEDGTYTYTDQYDFNDAKEGGMQGFRDEVARREEDGDPLTAYQKVRLFAKYMGSGPGEGANVKIIS
jgi:hypothetical protein